MNGFSKSLLSQQNDLLKHQELLCQKRAGFDEEYATKVLRIQDYPVEQQPFLQRELYSGYMDLIQPLELQYATNRGNFQQLESQLQTLKQLRVLGPVLEDSNIPMHTPGDPPHALQLVVGYILEHPQLAPWVTKATTVAKAFKNTKCLQFLKIAAELDDDARLGMGIGGTMRWGSHLRMFQKLLNLKTPIQQVMFVEEAQQYIGELPDLVLSNEFWDQLQIIIATIQSIVFGIDTLQGDNCISNVLGVWLRLEKEFSAETCSPEKKELYLFISRHLEISWNLIVDPIHFASFLMDPRYRYQQMDESEYLAGEKLIEKLAQSFPNPAQIMDLFYQFRNRNSWNVGIFAWSDKFGGNPISYWGRLETQSKYRDLAKIGIHCLSFPQSSAAVERSFTC